MSTKIHHYHMNFTLGDWSKDGHGMMEEFHITANHSVKEIDAAVKKFEKETTFKISNWAEEYEDNSLPASVVNKLTKLGFITDKENIPGVDGWAEDDDYSFNGADGYTAFILNVIVKHYIPDFEWGIYNIPHEQTLDCLDGNGYGLFCL